MRLEDRVGAKPGLKSVPLEPFGHQVAGQASMLTVDATTVCKPLIPREYHLYRTLPDQLVPFTPAYKGILYVCLEEVEDGCLNLWGYCPDGDDLPCPQDADDDMAGTNTSSRKEEQEEERLLQPLQQDWSSGASTPLSSDSELDVPSAVEGGQSRQSSRPSSGCVVRVRLDGEYEVKASSAADDKFLISTNEDSVPQAAHGNGVSDALTTQPLNPWGLSLHTRLLDKMRKAAPTSSGCPFLALENVVARYVRPCILDLKVGSRLHGDDATQKKIASQSRKCNMTTSRSLGLRLCGMQVYQVTTGAYKSVDKYHGRTLTDDTFCDILRDFLHNDQRLRVELLAPILARLSALLSCLRELNSFRFYASSLLIMYDGHCPDSKQRSDREFSAKGTATSDSGMMSHVGENYPKQGVHNSSNPVAETSMARSLVRSNQNSQEDCVAETSSSSDEASLESVTKQTTCEVSESSVEGDNGNSVPPLLDLVDVRMIDFAHTTHSGFRDDVVVHEGPDTDYMWGLQNLINMFLQMQRENCS